MDEKTNSALTAAFFAMLLLIFTAADFLRKDRLYSESENRMLAERPKLSAESVLDGSYMEQYETYVTDQFIGRDRWVELKTRGELLLQKKQINGVYLGEDGYLIEQHLPDGISEEKVEEKIGLLKRLTEKYDAKVMLVPTADNILTDKLPLWAQYYDQRKLLDRVEEAIGEERMIDVYDALQAHAAEPIYYRTDPRWTSTGAYYAYLEWKKKAGGAAVETFDPARMVTVSDQFLGTLHSRVNLPWQPDTIQIFPETVKRQPAVTYDSSLKTNSLYEAKYLTVKNKYGYFLDDNHPFTEIETGYRRGRELLLFKDSFANCIIPLLANHYDRIYAVDLRYSGALPDPLDTYVTPHTDVLVLCDCIHFIEDFHCAE